MNYILNDADLDAVSGGEPMRPADARALSLALNACASANYACGNTALGDAQVNQAIGIRQGAGILPK